MLRRSLCASGGEPSFFYVMMADSCFQRATSTRHPNAGGTLRTIGRDYLTKATEVRSVFEAEQLQPATGGGPDRQHIGGTG